MWCQLGRNSAYANIVQNRQRGPIEWDRHLKEMEVVALLYLQTFFCNTEQWLQFHFKERTSSEEMNDFVR